MNSRERVLAAVAHRSPDQTPFDYWARKDVTARLMKFLGLSSHEALLRRLRIDLRGISIEEHIPAFDARTNGVLGGQSESSGRRYILSEAGSFEDAWGIVRRLGSTGLYDEWMRGPFVKTTDLDSFAWPGGDIFDSVETLRSRVQAHEGRYALMGRINLPFKVAWHMRGMENFLCDMLAEPDFARALLQRVADYELEKAVRLVRAGVDVIGIYGDLAMQDRMLVQPDSWRASEKPILREMISQLRRLKPDLRILFHSDGDVTEILPDYLEIGADLVNPIQPECMDPAKVKREFGDRLTMHGTISLQKTLPHGTPDDVRAEVRQRIATCGENGGLILCPANAMQNDTPLENILALYDAERSPA